MTLLDLHVELAETNRLLTRIAEALDRAIPIIATPDHSAHPLIGLTDISRVDPARQSAQPANLPFRASDRVRFSLHADRASQQPTTASDTKASVTGQWDHDDPLDTLEEFDSQWDNYAGVDR